MTNPLIAPWAGPFGGLPPFATAKVEHFAAAIAAGMAEQEAAIEKIAADPAPPTFKNTLEALERSGRTLDRVLRVYGVFSSSFSTPAFQAVEREQAPRLAAFSDRITQNERLFRRIAAVYEARATSGLTAEQQRLAWLQYTSFVRGGARLDAPAKVRVAAINERLAALSTDFTQRVMADEDEGVQVLAEEADLAGLSASQREEVAAAAAAKKLKARGAVLNTRSSVEPFLTSSTRRDLREQVWRRFVTRGDHGDAHDTKALITEILGLRDERARLLGYPSYAHWAIEQSMAKNPERALGLLETVWPAAVARVREEVADMQAVADKEGAKLGVEPWDYRFYAEKVRQAKYALDENEVKPYLQLEKLREGMFWVAGQLLDLHFTPAAGVPVPDPDVRVWEVKDGAGHHVGLWYFDPYARTGKRSGAWMNAYRDQERLDGEVTTIVSNNCNFVKGKPGEPVLVSWIDATTLFHEFGHALHGLSSSVTYQSLSGTSVARDYVEFPSQVMERWVATRPVLDQFARHVATGKPMPEALVKKLEAAARFNKGFDTVEYMASALVDLKAHLVTGRAVDPAAFEKETLAALGMPREIVMRHRLPQFNHLFADEGYAAGYYAYLWADTISADAYEAFTEAGGPYDKAVAARLKRFVFSVGNTVDPADGYRAFRGRDPDIGALMRHRGFPVVKAAGAAETRPDATPSAK